jgi:nicotinate-nucleotide adenylyltransferase
LKNQKIKKNIGLFGGTFDPIHFGHLRLSARALIKLKLDEIWWVISLSNPLKKKKEISDFEERFSNAKKNTPNLKILVCDLEKKINSPFTIDLLDYLKINHPKTNFVWIMGMDSMEKFHNWKDWKKIFSKVPIAIFDRPFYSLNVQKSRSLGFFKKNRLHVSKAKKLKNMMPPCWVFLTGWANNISSSQMKAKKKIYAKPNSN